MTALFRIRWLALLVAASALANCRKPSAQKQTTLVVPSIARRAASSPSASATPTSTDEEWEAEMQEECGRLAARQPPGADLPTAAERAALRGCDAETAYYGIGVPVDYREARLCAFTHAELSPRQGDFYTTRCLDCSGVIEGPAVLTMIYANGRGVPVDFELALRFACDAGGTPIELSARMWRLAEARKRGAQDKPLDFCDDVSSGYMSGACAAHRERIAAVPRKARLAAVSKALPQRELATFLDAAPHYFDLREGNEVDLTGTARAMFQVQERAKLEDELVQTLEQLANPRFAPAAADATTERGLVAKLPRSSDCKADPEPPPLVGMPTCAGMLETQRAWAPYRRAFIALALRARPDVSQQRWSSWIIRQRLKQLSE